MKSSYEIYCDFRNAKKQADKLDSLASDVESRVVREMSSAEQRLHSAWTGDSSNRFIQKESNLRGQINSAAKELRDIAQGIRDVAQRIYDAEMRALVIAQQRTSG